jgi:hypothetical protein
VALYAELTMNQLMGNVVDDRRIELLTSALRSDVT